ncbi:sugar transferase [Virgisporangium aurantiacum]|uniref:Exopolysaccharide biosynthesis polyprenyl glycosylphosphotransferase n=1 Tax=Virgisporangium aurantiacum TaxID=175570 RepID=A0A8J3Z919_9ACTN|nr:sugar transferase [Virgisporangium aurantiacum]GIJ59779.1 exopolysaccharide biosynthesis polyprenyl glycosylphosphotransferase [Virgisporangium aurantiacum]
MQPMLDSFEIIPDRPLQTGGVPRVGWSRTRPASTWHRVYLVALVFLDFGAAMMADLISVNLFPTKAGSDLFNPAFLRLVTLVLLPAAWVIVLWSHGAYDRRYLGVGTDEFKRVVRASWTIVAVVAFLAFASQRDLSRMSVGVALLGGLCCILLLRFLARSVLHLLRQKAGIATHKMVLVGTLPEALEVYNAITRNPSAGLMPVAIALTEGYTTGNGRPTPVPVYAGRDVASLVAEYNADTIAVCGGAAGTEPGELRRLAWQLEGTGVDLVVAPQLTDIAGPRVHIRPVEGLPLLYVEEPKISGIGWLIKNFLDRLIALLGLIVLSPVFLAIAVAIRLSDKGPIFFRQARTGREGQTFRVWKFRTMYVDAEDRLAEMKDLNETDGMLFKIKTNDPRVFPAGRFLRISSMDELPQLINVLMGEMSLVGPRPLPADDGDFLGDVRRRLLVRPGITGLWQVSGRSDLSWDDAVRLDLYYVDNWSLVLDLHILWRTIGVVLRSKGAY